MQLYIESISAWSTSYSDPVNTAENPQMTAPAWPKLEFVPAMQRRRLSPFAKIALHTAEHALSACFETSESATAEQSAQIDIVFSSRHGDLHKTAELLTALTAGQDISPTAFSTSVHNAVPGLYSIIKQNKQAINAISAGKDSFFYGFVDAYARLKSGRANKLLIVHVDRELPELYAQFQDEQQVAHAVAMVVTLTPTPATIAHIDINFSTVSDTEKGENRGSQQHDQQDPALNLPAALCFMDWFTATPNSAPSTGLEYISDRHVWTCDLISGMMNV